MLTHSKKPAAENPVSGAAVTRYDHDPKSADQFGSLASTRFTNQGTQLLPRLQPGRGRVCGLTDCHSTPAGKKIWKHHNASLPQDCVTFHSRGALRRYTMFLWTTPPLGTRRML